MSYVYLGQLGADQEFRSEETSDSFFSPIVEWAEGIFGSENETGPSTTPSGPPVSSKTGQPCYSFANGEAIFNTSGKCVLLKCYDGYVLNAPGDACMNSAPDPAKVDVRPGGLCAVENGYGYMQANGKCKPHACYGNTKLIDFGKGLQCFPYDPLTGGIGTVRQEPGFFDNLTSSFSNLFGGGEAPSVESSGGGAPTGGGGVPAGGGGVPAGGGGVPAGGGGVPAPWVTDDSYRTAALVVAGVAVLGFAWYLTKE